MAAAHKHVGQVLLNQGAGALLVCRIADGPHKRNGHAFDAFAFEYVDGFEDVVFIERGVFAAVGQHTPAHAETQLAWCQLRRGRVAGVVAVAFFFVAETDFNAVFVSGGGQQAHFYAFKLNQGIQRHGGAVDAQIAVLHDVGHRALELLADLLQAVGNGHGAVVRGGRAFKQVDAAVLFGQYKVGKSASGVYA